MLFERITKQNEKMIKIETIKRVALGQASEAERREAEAWAARSDERARFLADAGAFYRGGEVPDEEVAERLRQVWNNLERRLWRARLLRLMRFASAAACVVAIVGMAFWLWPEERETAAPARQVALRHPATVQIVLPDGSRHRVDEQSLAKTEVPGFRMNEEGELRQLAVDTTAALPEVKYNEVLVPRGATYTLVLADGTEVFLNAETRMRFPDRFTGGTREIFLDGEAFFDVRRDERHPFVVRAGDVSVRVLGTTFNVRAYADANTSATLVSGSVRFTSEGDSVVLRPGQQCELNAMNRRLSVREADVMSVLAWKDGDFVFRNEPLENVMEEVARWYDVDVVYASDELRTRKVYLYMDRPDTVEYMLEQLTLLGGVDYEIMDNRITLKEKKQ